MEVLTFVSYTAQSLVSGHLTESDIYQKEKGQENPRQRRIILRTQFWALALQNCDSNAETLFEYPVAIQIR
jgi:hypothetical protein